MYEAAKKLYERTLNALRKQPLTNQTSIDATTKDIQRVAACQSAVTHNSRRQRNGAVSECRQILDNIRDSGTLDLKTKLAMMDRICSNITSGFSDSEDVKRKADQLRGEYRKESQCLYMAEDLNKTAFKLEGAGMYPMAEKLYREALAIKLKNLGPTDPDTLTEYGELARLNSERGHIPEAIALYEQALAAFRKLPTKGESYCLLLQSYGDLLAHQNKKKKADKIYEEARTFYTSAHTVQGPSSQTITN